MFTGKYVHAFRQPHIHTTWCGHKYFGASFVAMKVLRMPTGRAGKFLCCRRNFICCNMKTIWKISASSFVLRYSKEQSLSWYSIMYPKVISVGHRHMPAKGSARSPWDYSWSNGQMWQYIPLYHSYFLIGFLSFFILSFLSFFFFILLKFVLVKWSGCSLTEVMLSFSTKVSEYKLRYYFNNWEIITS